VGLSAQIEYFESILPIIIINTNNQTILDETRITCNMGIVNNENGINSPLDPFNDYNGQISIEIRGSASSFFPKKSYSLETQTLDGKNNNISLLDMPKENDWILYGPYEDQTLIRNTLTYKLFEKMGHYAPRSKYCELFINNDYVGVYLLIEKIKRDKNRVDIEEIDNKNISGGYILKIDHMNINGNSVKESEYWNSNYLSIGGDSTYFQYYYPKYDEISSDQKNYIQYFINEFESELNSPEGMDELAAKIDFKSAIDFFLIQEFSKNIDAYRASTYIYKNNSLISEKLFFGPVWDFNYAYGSGSFCEGDQFIGWQNNSSCGTANPVWFKKFLEDTIYTNQLNCRWIELRNSILSVTEIFSLTDSLIEATQNARERNFQRWGLSETVYNLKILELKSWIINRLQWLDQNMFGYCDDLNALNIKSLVKIVDILGKETSNKGFQLHIYDDGSVEKKYIVK
tara:strand:- start:1122 stop:2495 length:1374 start_codon:yes stop_codon:yes gene_type:complete